MEFVNPGVTDLALPVLVFVVGLCFGSFITLLSWRLPRNEKLGMTRSACLGCRSVLPPRALVPVFSWLLQRGRCHACRAIIHWRYPLTELVTAGAFLAIYLGHGPSGGALALMGLTVALMVMIVVDFEHRILPDEMQIMAGLLAFAYHPFATMHIADRLGGMLLGAFAGWGLQKGYRLLRGRDGLGTGDVKFLAVAGLWLGPAGLVPLCFYSGVLGIVTAMVWRLKSDDPRFPFGPALAFAMWMMLVWPITAASFWHWPEWFIPRA